MTPSRTRFALLPRRLWRLNAAGFIEPCGWAWLRRVVEVRVGLLDEWTAYEHLQRRAS